MPSFSKISRQRLASCDERLQEICNEAIRFVDFSILCGHRGKAAQDEAVRTKKSTKRWPDSKHNSLPSMAVDIAPYVPELRGPDWDDLAAFARLVGYIERIADEKGYKIRWGGDWNRNRRTKDEKFIDGPHIELED